MCALLYLFDMSKRSLGILALVFTTIFWGIGPVAAKAGLEEMGPFTLAFLRNVLSLSLILPFVLYRNLLRVKKGDLPTLLIIGFFGSGLNAIFFLTGVDKTSAASSAAIFATVPLINIIAASLILKEKPSLARVLGVIIGFVGSFTIALGPYFLGKGKIDGDVLGNALVLGAAFSWVCYIIGSKELLKKYSPFTIVTFSLISGIITLLPLFALEFLGNPNWYLSIGSAGLISIVYGGLMSGFLAFILFQWGMQYVSAIEVGIFIYLQPVITDIFASSILGEQLSSLFLVGSGLILGGVFLATTYELIQ